MSDRFHKEYEQRKQDRAAAFHGKCYRYNTPADGPNKIGVMAGLGGDIYIVGYFRDNGARKAIKAPSLRACYSAAQLQIHLELWAKQRGLEVAP